MERTWQQVYLRPINIHTTTLAWELSGTPPAREPQTCFISFPNAAESRDCPVKGYKGRAVMVTWLRVHFLHRHMWDIVVILKDGNLLHPWCPFCDMLVLWEDLNSLHPNTAQYAKGEEWRKI